MDKSYVQKVYNQHAPEIYRFCMFKVRNREEAEDITAETFARLAQSDSNHIQQVRPWLFKVSRNIIYDTYIRSAYKRVQNVDSEVIMNTEDQNMSVEHIAIEDSLKDAIQQSLQELDPAVADIIIMKVWEDMQFNEIADITESNVNTVKAQYYRGIEKLKELAVQKEPKYRTYSFSAPLIAAGVFAVSQSGQFSLPAAAASTIAGSAGIAAVTSASVVTGTVASTGLFSTAAAKAIAVVVATGAITFGGIAGVQYLKNLSSPNNLFNDNEVPQETPMEDCEKTYTHEDLYGATFTYDSCVWSIEQDDSESNQPSYEIALANKGTEKDYKVNIAILDQFGVAGNISLFCGDDFSIIDEDLARVRAYKFASDEEFIYYSTFTDKQLLSQKQPTDIDGKGQRDETFRKRLTGKSDRILCLMNFGVEYFTITLPNTGTEPQVPDPIASIQVDIDGLDLSTLTDEELLEIDEMVKTMKFEDQNVEVAKNPNFKEVTQVITTKHLEWTNVLEYEMQFKIPNNASIKLREYPPSLSVMINEESILQIGIPPEGGFTSFNSLPEPFILDNDTLWYKARVESGSYYYTNGFRMSDCGFDMGTEQERKPPCGSSVFSIYGDGKRGPIYIVCLKNNSSSLTTQHEAICDEIVKTLNWEIIEGYISE